MWSRQEYFEQRNQRIVEQVSERGEWVVHSSPYPCRRKSSIVKDVSVNTNSHMSVPYTPLRQGICDEDKQFKFVSSYVSQAQLVARIVSIA